MKFMSTIEFFIICIGMQILTFCPRGNTVKRNKHVPDVTKVRLATLR